MLLGDIDGRLEVSDGHILDGPELKQLQRGRDVGEAGAEASGFRFRAVDKYKRF